MKTQRLLKFLLMNIQNFELNNDSFQYTDFSFLPVIWKHQVDRNAKSLVSLI